MNKPPNLYWDEKIVMIYLQEAAAIHARLPPVKVQGYFSLMPAPLKDEWDKLYDALNGKTTLGAPMPAEVTYHEEIMALLAHLNRSEQVVAWMRANRVPWLILVDELQTSQSTLQRRLRGALARLVIKLNRIDPSGDYYQRLRARANGLTAL